jgi:predicted PurR-regulated permease PerM
MHFSIRNVFFLALLLGVIFMAFRLFQPHLITLAVAATFAVMLYPVHRRIRSRIRAGDGLAAIVTVLLTIIVILLPLGLIIAQIARQAADLYGNLTENASFPLRNVIGMAEDTLEQWIPMQINLGTYIGTGASWLAQHLGMMLTGTIDTVVKLFLGIIAYYYMLKDGDRFMAKLIELSPLADKQDTKILARLSQSINSVVKGSLIIALVQGIASGIGFAIFGMPFALLLGAVAGVAAFIPSLGPSMILFPAAGYLFFTGHTASAIGLTIWAIVAVGSIDNFLYPMLVGRRAEIHPFFILFSVIGGISLFGMAGLVIGPLIISLLLALLDIYEHERIAKT